MTLTFLDRLSDILIEDYIQGKYWEEEVTDFYSTISSQTKDLYAKIHNFPIKQNYRDDDGIVYVGVIPFLLEDAGLGF